MYKPAAQELLNSLYRVQRAPTPCFGICSQCDDPGYILDDLFKRWPKFSGRINYPIPNGSETLGADVYSLAARNGTMWDRGTEYGALRWELLEFCIAELEKELKQ